MHWSLHFGPPEVDTGFEIATFTKARDLAARSASEGSRRIVGFGLVSYATGIVVR